MIGLVQTAENSNSTYSASFDQIIPEILLINVCVIWVIMTKILKLVSFRLEVCVNIGNNFETVSVFACQTSKYPLKYTPADEHFNGYLVRKRPKDLTS